MVTLLGRGQACRSAGQRARKAAPALALGLLYALAPPGAQASKISKEFSGHAVHQHWNDFVHQVRHVEHQVLPHHHRSHAARGVHQERAVAPFVAAQEATATAPLSTHQIHAAAMEASNPGVASSVVRPLLKIKAVDGLLSHDPATVYLEMRRDLDPARFDHYHPRLGGILARDGQIRRAQQVGTVALDTRPVTAAQEVAPGTPPCGAMTPTVHPAQQTVPEPGTAAIALTLIGAVALARRFRRKS